MSSSLSSGKLLALSISKSPFLVLALLLLMVLQATPIPNVRATHPTDLWRPYGPHIGKALIQVYADDLAEFNDFEIGNLDLTDTQVAPGNEVSYSQNPDFHLTEPIGEFGMFDIQFNQANSFWGIPFGFGNSQSGIEIRMAFAHLLDKNSFIAGPALGGRAQKIDDPVPPAEGLATANTAAWDPVHPGTVSAFNLAADAGGVAAPGSPDFLAARDHLLRVRNAAGALVFFDNNNDGVIDNPPTTKITFYIRSDHPPRLELGTALAHAIESLFGGADVVDEQFANIVQVSDFVFRTSPATTDWHIYTGGWRLGAFWDHLFALYDSKFASNLCGGKKSQFAQNYVFVCMPDFDTQVEASIGATSFSQSAASALNAMNIFGQRVATIPVYSAAGRAVYRAGWGGAVNQLGVGPSNPWSLLNMRPDGTRGDVPAIPDTLRWGFKQGTNTLNIFHAQTLWEFFILLEIYDSLLAQNPRNAGQLFDWMTIKHFQYVNAAPSDIGYQRPAGSNTTLRFVLRNNVFWQDGVQLTSQDVKFSILNYRDIPSANLFPTVALVVDVVAVTPRIVDVHLSGLSIFNELNIGGLPIIPKHVWDTDNDGFADFDKIDLSYDPLSSGGLIGSGPFVCKHRDTGQVGGGCSENADGSLGGQNIAVGGRFLLTKYDFSSSLGRQHQYFRSTGNWPTSLSGNFQEFSWSDVNNDGKVNILDIASVALCFDQLPVGACAYWNKPIGTDPAKVDIGELSTVASRFEETWTGPFAWGTLNDIDTFTP